MQQCLLKDGALGKGTMAPSTRVRYSQSFGFKLPRSPSITSRVLIRMSLNKMREKSLLCRTPASAVNTRIRSYSAEVSVIKQLLSPRRSNLQDMRLIDKGDRVDQFFAHELCVENLAQNKCPYPNAE